MEATSELNEVLALRSLIESGRARELRERARISKAVAGRSCGVTASAVSLWEEGRREPRGENVHAYYQFLRQLAERALSVEDQQFVEQVIAAAGLPTSAELAELRALLRPSARDGAAAA